MRMEKFGISGPVQHIDRDQAEAVLSELTTGQGGALSTSGGGAANVAKISAMLGIKAAFCGCVGQDPLAEVFTEDLKRAGASVILSHGKEKTGVCLILSSGKERRIAASPGAALELSWSYIDGALLSKTKVVVIDGYILDNRHLVQQILMHSGSLKIPAAIDAASAFLIRDRTEDILHYSRNYPIFLFMNADEAIVFYNSILKSSRDEAGMSESEKIETIFLSVCPMLKIITEGKTFPVIVIKLGSQGAVVIAGGRIYREETFLASSGDTVGLGDAFAAAFLSSWIRGHSLSECAAMGNKVAKRILEVPGTAIDSSRLEPFAKSLALQKP